MQRAVKLACFNLTKADRNYTYTKKKCLATVYAFGMFRLYVDGSFFVAATGHHSLCPVVSVKTTSRH